ncbi:MAG: hypothetical protein ACREXM_15655 [Gammaproteobacteria bacterium]
MSLGRVARWLAAGVAFLTVTLAVGLGILVWDRAAPPGAITRTLEAARPWLFLWRLALSVTLIGFWPVFCQNLARWRHWTADHLQRLLGARWTVAAWLVVLELLLGQNVVGRFIHLWA